MDTALPRFRDAYLREAAIEPARFERQLFLNCVPPLQRPAARILLWLKPSVFERDLETIREVADATSEEEVRISAGELRGGHRYRRTVVRDAMGVRASGRRLIAISRRVLAARG